MVVHQFSRSDDSNKDSTESVVNDNARLTDRGTEVVITDRLLSLGHLLGSYRTG